MEIRAELNELLNEFYPGQKIPSERVLAERFGVARMTLRHAIETFILEGKLERRPGSGTYISNQCYSLSARCRSFSSEMNIPIPPVSAPLKRMVLVSLGGSTVTKSYAEKSIELSAAFIAS